MKLITIFTPTYNRAYVLYNLYESLIQQENKNFIWLIIDDGSTDNTEEIVNKWMRENKINIRYFKQDNKGKTAAHNKGSDLTESELFVCVDSDDYLTLDAVNVIDKTWGEINKKNIVGMLAYKGTKVGGSITKIHDDKCISDSLINLYENRGLKGDTMLIYRTEVIKKYRFPIFDNEKFVPESYLYDLIDQDGKLFIIRKVLYVCEYLDDGYSKNMARTIKNNPMGYIAYIKQRTNFDTKFKNIYFDYIKYIAVQMSIPNKKLDLGKQRRISMLALIPAYILYIRRYKYI